MIQVLKDKEVFIFGSNLAGNHAGGAARQAKEQFGAQEGVGEGRTGQSYAFPTLNENLKKRSDEDLKKSIQYLYEYCEGNKDQKFLLTKVGCGIAGYEEEYMKSLFKNPPHNLVLPEEWINPTVE